MELSWGCFKRWAAIFQLQCCICGLIMLIWASATLWSRIRGVSSSSWGCPLQGYTVTGARKRGWYHLQLEVVAPGSLCTAETLAIPTCFTGYLLVHHLLALSGSNATLPPVCQLPPLLSVVALSPHDLHGALLCHLVLVVRSISKPFCLVSPAQLLSYCRYLFSLPLPL